MDGRIAKVALVMALIVTGAIGATISIRAYRYHFVGRDAKGTYHFETEPETIYERTYQDENGKARGLKVGRGGSVTIGARNGEAADVEQMQSDLEETAYLREQGLRELETVVDTSVNGHLTRSGVYRYVLADGRILSIGESIPSKEVPRTPARIESDNDEAERLRKQGVQDVIDVVEYDIEGQIWRVLTCRYVLADGREITFGEGDPKLPPVSKIPTPEQIHEVTRLKSLGQCESLGASERRMYGKAFNFETFLFTLADGTVLTQARGTPFGGKVSLTEADHEELTELTRQHAGEDLGMYEEEIDGTVFAFERKRYVLSDGSEVIRGIGRPERTEGSNP
jgi:hypothetical protein